MNPFKAVEWGKAMYALGGGFPFAVIKALGYGWNAWYFMKGYLSRKGIRKHPDICSYVRRQQYSRLLGKLGIKVW